jgi:signal transduction histidine kinase
MHPLRKTARFTVRSTLALALAACATNPVTGKREISLVSQDQEVQMGQQGAEQVAQEIGLINDQALQQYVQQVGAAIATKSERPNLPWTFRVVDDPTPNAFALPGGFIFVTRGLLDLMGNEAELASVLGHEIGHVTARHSVHQMSQQQLLEVINDVLAYTKLEAGILHFIVEDVPVDEVLLRCSAFVSQDARKKKLELRNGCGVPGLTARADGAKVEQIIIDLLRNAIKFTNPGGLITVSCQEENGERVHISVSDTGHGIEESNLECIFQPFVQVDAKLTRAQDGTGLGLAISREMARRMGGDLTLVSEMGAGSSFTLTLASGRGVQRNPDSNGSSPAI